MQQRPADKTTGKEEAKMAQVDLSKTVDESTASQGPKLPGINEIQNYLSGFLPAGEQVLGDVAREKLPSYWSALPIGQPIQEEHGLIIHKVDQDRLAICRPPETNGIELLSQALLSGDINICISAKISDEVLDQQEDFDEDIIREISVRSIANMRRDFESVVSAWLPTRVFSMASLPSKAPKKVAAIPHYQVPEKVQSMKSGGSCAVSKANPALLHAFNHGLKLVEIGDWCFSRGKEGAENIAIYSKQNQQGINVVLISKPVDSLFPKVVLFTNDVTNKAIKDAEQRKQLLLQLANMIEMFAGKALQEQDLTGSATDTNTSSVTPMSISSVSNSSVISMSVSSVNSTASNSFSTESKATSQAHTANKEEEKPPALVAEITAPLVEMEKLESVTAGVNGVNTKVKLTVNTHFVDWFEQLTTGEMIKIDDFSSVQRAKDDMLVIFLDEPGKQKFSVQIQRAKQESGLAQFSIVHLSTAGASNEDQFLASVTLFEKAIGWLGWIVAKTSVPHNELGQIVPPGLGAIQADKNDHNATFALLAVDQQFIAWFDSLPLPKRGESTSISAGLDHLSVFRGSDDVVSITEGPGTPGVQIKRRKLAIGVVFTITNNILADDQRLSSIPERQTFLKNLHSKLGPIMVNTKHEMKRLALENASKLAMKKA